MGRYRNYEPPGLATELELRRELAVVRVARGYDIPMVCAACGAALPDVCAFHPWEECTGRSSDMPGESVNRLAAQQAFLLAVWEALPETQPGAFYVDLKQRLAEQLGEQQVRGLAAALDYLKARGAVCHEDGRGWWRRMEKKP